LSVQKAMQNISGEIIVVDNNSTDGSQTFFEEKFKNVSFIFNNKNEGFSKANNRALKIASGDYILFLNPDTIVAEDCFEKCISFVNSQKDNCALGIKMLDGAGNFLKESKRAFPSPMTSLYKLSGLARLFPRSPIFAKYYLGNLDENENHEVDVLAGAFMLIPKKILNIVGGFDEDFFMYGEDIDLSFRIQKAGFANIYFAQSSIIHFKGESTKKGSVKYVRMFYKAMRIFVRKHYANAKAGLFIFLIDIAIFFRGALSVIRAFFRSVIVPFKKISAKRIQLSHEIKSIAIAGTDDEFLRVEKILAAAGTTESIWGRIEPTANGVVSILQKNGLKEIIFCEGQLSFKNIIEVIAQIPPGIRIKYFAKGSHSIIGSDDKNISGEIIFDEKDNV
jgi:GT2 family glycosyltransferase